jgi:hypothetical protein
VRNAHGGDITAPSGARFGFRGITMEPA